MRRPAGWPYRRGPRGPANRGNTGALGGSEEAMYDDDLRRRVVAELSGDPRVDGETVQISTADGTVTLRGIVASLRLKRPAGRAVARVRGVASIANELRVQLPAEDRRDNDDLRGDVLEALMLDTSVPMTVDARVRNGFVTWSAAGVIQIDDRIRVESRP
jgi:BON domain